MLDVHHKHVNILNDFKGVIMFGVIIGIDIEKYSQTDRTDEMKSKRQVLSQIINESTMNIEIFKKKDTIDTGDGGFILIETSKYEDVLYAMNKIQENASKNDTIRFRAILHIGKYSETRKIFSENSSEDTGFAGDGINCAARYLDAICLKELLRINSATNFVYGISNEFYKQVFDQEYFDNNDYTKYGFQVKNYSNLIFLNTKNIEIVPDVEKIQKNNSFKLSSDFSNFLEKSDFIYQNEKEKSNLSTFYVFPDVVTDSPESKSIYKVSTEEILRSFIKNPSHIVISGDDQSGKTGLAKVMFKKIYETNDYVPIYIKFTVSEKGELSKKINNALHLEYNEDVNHNYDDKIKVIILDDFHYLDNVYQRKYLEFLKNEKNVFLIIFVDSLFNGAIDKQRLVDYFKSYTITPFGYVLRKKIIEKWIEFNGINEDNYCTEDELTEYLETTFVRGIIPFTPFYILTALAAKTDFVPLNGDITSKGHCYQALIYISFRKSNIPESEIGAFLNILSNISFTFYQNSISSFNEDALYCFLESYAEKYNLPFDNKYFIKLISRSTIFYKNSIGQYTFCAPYFYHYFVAKYIADRLSNKDMQKYIEEIYSNLDVQMNAYIGIFLIHHSKDVRLIEEVLVNTMILYDKYEEISLTRDEIQHIDDYANKLNNEVIEKYDKSREARMNLLSYKDSQNGDENEDINEYSKEINESKEINAELLNLKKAIRTVEVMGHILKNHSGELEKKHLKECYINAINAYRRMCNKFITEFKEYEKDFVDFVVNRIESMEKNSFTREDIFKYAQRFFSFFNLSIIYATIKRTADSVGSKGMMKIIKEVSEDIQNPFTYCIYLQCEMWYNKTVPVEDAKKHYKDFPISVQHIIQRFLKEFTDLHHVKYKEKQQIAASFNMKLSSLEYDYKK